MEDLIPTHGGYRNLKSLQVGQLVYDITVRFTERYEDSKKEGGFTERLYRMRSQNRQSRPPSR